MRAGQAARRPAVEAHGRVDVIINNAGLMPHSPLERGKVEDWDRMIDVNIKGVLYGIAAALPHMTAQKSGHIINVSSVAGHKVRPGGRRLCRDQACGAHALGGAAAGGEAVQYPHDDHLAGRRRVPSCRKASRKPMSPAGIQASTGLCDPGGRFARVVAFAISQPDDVDINEILFRPTAQEL